MGTPDREREFSRRELLRAGWSVPVALSLGGLAAACGGGTGGHDDLAQELVEIARRGEDESIPRTSSAPQSSVSTTTPGSTATTSPPGSTAPSTGHADTGRRGGGNVHTDVAHVDSAHGDVAAASIPHGDDHGDAPETIHDDAFAAEQGLGPRLVTIPHVDTPHTDVAHSDTGHVDAPHADTPHGDS